jgi:hypothetical protein
MVAGRGPEVCVTTNPYLNRSAIRDAGSFVGRASELTRLFNRIGGSQPQSVSIVGDRRIGKSSLLRALMAQRTKYLPRPDAYMFVYLDMQSRLRWTPEIFFEKLAAEVAASAGGDASVIASYDGFEHWARSLQSTGRALVLLIDEFHVLMKEDSSGHQLPIEFFNYLRSLANSYSVSIVVTSHVDLYTLSTEHKLAGSPLFNILHKLHLGPFSEDETRALIALSGHEDLSLEADEDWIVSRGGHHPLFLQIACSVAFDWRAEHGTARPLDTVAADTRFLEEARPHFEGTWKLFTSTERQVVVDSATGMRRTDSTPTIDALMQRGYLVRRGADIVVFSEAFGSFARTSSSLSPLPDSLPSACADPEPTQTKARVFISYASEDRAEVADLYRRLKDSGLDPWMDAHDLIAGDPWARTIDEAIQSADFFVICLTTRSVDKAGVLRQELSRGVHQWYTRSGPDNFLIPVLLEECRVPDSLATVQHVALWKEGGWSRLRSDFEKAIKRRANLAAPIARQPWYRTLVDAGIGVAERAGAWMKRHAFALGVSLTFLGVLLLIGGLSGDALSRLVSVVGLERAQRWNVVLRGLEIGTLTFGAACITVAFVRRMGRSVGVAASTALWVVCALLIRIDVPAPSAFALAYDRYLTNRSTEWQQRLLSFRDPATAGIRDGSDNRRVQAWTTAQSIVGLLASVDYEAPKLPRDDLRGAFRYLESVRLSGTENGWGYFADRETAITEITSWIALAEIASLRAKLWNPAEAMVMTTRVSRDLGVVLSRQTASGGWSPVNDNRDENSRTYSTIMALWAIAAAADEGLGEDWHKQRAERGVDWLLNERHPQLGWVPNPRRRYQTEEFPGLTGQTLVVLKALTRHLPSLATDARLRDAQRKFTETFVSAAPIRANARIPDSDQHVHLGTSSTLLEGSTFLWYPWARAAFALLAQDAGLSADDRSRAARLRAALTLRTEELSHYLDNGLPYLLAENLLCISLAGGS